MADQDFVGRSGLVEQILGEVGGIGRTGMFFDVDGIPGIGKTRLLDQLVKLTRPGDAVVRINGSDFEARGSRARAATADQDAELRQFRILLRGALESLPDDEQITDVLNYLTSYSESAQREQRADFVHDPDEVLDRATAAANHAGKALEATRARFLILVDDFHLLAGRPLGQWVISWLVGVRGADVVVAHEDFRSADDAGLPSRAVRLPLSNLSREDVEAYLKSHPDVGPDVAGIVDRVWDFTGGYPQALVLVADLIKGSASRDIAVQLIEQLAALQGGRAAQLEALANRVLDMVQDEELRDTLYQVCVTRHFDGPLIQRLMGVDEQRAQTLIDRLSHYSFVRESMAAHSFLTVSDFVRHVGEKHLGAAKIQAIHGLAADYYRGLITDAVGEDEDSYESWFRYERPDFQALERDWLYHLSRLAGSTRQVGRVGIARIFLDAFVWWGSYMPFPFCEQVLADWTDATLDNGEDRAWGTQLHELYESYPKGWRKGAAPAEQWKKARYALRYISHHGHFHHAQPADSEMRHIRGILDIYLADTARYADPGDPEIDERLDDAAEQFTANDEEWNAAWVEYQRADVAAARAASSEQADAVISMTQATAVRHPGLDDNELLANLNRVCADAEWLRPDPGAALDALARAVLHAYRFQVKGVQDDYTDAFQQEMIERSTDRLVAWHGDDRDTGHAALRSACARIHAFFGPYWRETGTDAPADVGLEVVKALDAGRLDDVAVILFPARPTVLGYHGTPYELTCLEVTQRMRRELAEPPGTALPPAKA